MCNLLASAMDCSGYLDHTSLSSLLYLLISPDVVNTYLTFLLSCRFICLLFRYSYPYAHAHTCSVIPSIALFDAYSLSYTLVLTKYLSSTLASSCHMTSLHVLYMCQLFSLSSLNSNLVYNILL